MLTFKNVFFPCKSYYQVFLDHHIDSFAMFYKNHVYGLLQKVKVPIHLCIELLLQFILFVTQS